MTFIDPQKIENTIRNYIYPIIAERLRRSVLHNFKEEGRPEKWLPSNRSNITNISKYDNKKRKGKTLFNKGTLRNSIQTKIVNDTITIGTSVVYARIHNDGGIIKKTVQVREHNRNISQAFGKKLPKTKTTTVKAHQRNINITIPKRQFMMVQKDDLTFFKNILLNGVLNEFNA